MSAVRTPMFIGDHARLHPDKAALIHGPSGTTITYRELDERSNQLVHALYAAGLQRGDRYALLMENNLRYLEICWAALRSGLQVVPINRFLTPDEVAYILDDSDAKVLISSMAMRDTAQALMADPSGPATRCSARWMADGQIEGFDSYEAIVGSQPTTPLEPEWLGATMLYSSGTTGRPKGVVRATPDRSVRQGPARREPLLTYGFCADTVYLSPAPLYHAAPLGYCMNTQFFGGTVVIMDKFDAVEALQTIERYRVTHSQWVPTMFVRMLKLDEAERKRHDVSSLRVSIHAAAPCPIDVKQQMIVWWGPVLFEYYAGSEANGITSLSSVEWMARPGSVGRALMGTLHICDDDGTELPAGEPGLIYFEREAMPFRYHKDPQKTHDAQHPKHPTWSTLGDVGYVDEDGYLYLTDRKSFMIISGGVNIYPQIIENALALHPDVLDVAVIGVPNEEMGEEVKAIVQPAAGVAPTPELADKLIEFLRDKVGRYMIPRSVDFVDELPRMPTGKLKKHELRDRYWPAK